MSLRLFEGSSHAKLYRQFRQKPPKALIQRIVDFLKEKYTGTLRQALDLGCGSGQCTFLVAEHFEKVLGADISLSQIDEANKDLLETGLKNVSFCVAPAERLPLEDKSVQLITVCTAAHWMDLPKLYEEGKRVLCPGGVLAIFCCELPTFVIENQTAKNEDMKKLMDEVDDFLLEYFEQGPLKLVVDKYKDIEIPYSDFTREFGFQDDIKVSLSGIIGNIRSYSGFQTLCARNGQDFGEEFLNATRNKFANLAGIGEDEFDSLLFIHVRKYFLIMART